MAANEIFQKMKVENRLDLFMETDAKWEWVPISDQHKQWNWNKANWIWSVRVCRVPKPSGSS